MFLYPINLLQKFYKIKKMAIDWHKNYFLNTFHRKYTKYLIENW